MRAALAALLLAACGDSTSLGTGDLGDASASDQICNASFSGAVVAIDSACDVTIAYASATVTWTLSTNGNIVPATNDTWTGVRVTFAGMPATGAYDASSAIGVDGQLSNLADIVTPYWIVSPTSGSLQASLTGLGGFDDLGGGDRLYPAPHGSIHATLVDDTDLGTSNVSLAVSF